MATPMDPKARYSQLMIALKGQEDGTAIKALTDLTYDSLCRTLRLAPGERAELAIQLVLLAKRSGQVINLEEEVKAPTSFVDPTPTQMNLPPAINESEAIEVEVALAALDQALAKDQGLVGDVDPNAPVEDEVLALSTEGGLIDRLFYAIEKRPEITDEEMVQVLTKRQPEGEEILLTKVVEHIQPSEFDFSGNYELTDAPEETIVPERGYGMDFGFVSLGE